jgi:hypothetical protein
VKKNLIPSHFFVLMENPDKMLKYAAKVIEDSCGTNSRALGQTAGISNVRIFFNYIRSLTRGKATGVSLAVHKTGKG